MLALLAGCAAPAPRLPPPSPPSAPRPVARADRPERSDAHDPSGEVHELLATSVEPLWAEPSAPPSLACVPPARPRGRVVSFEVTPVRVTPLRIGPRVRVRAVEYPPRPVAAVTLAVRAHEDALNACYRWARSATPSLEAELTLRARFDEWGALDALEARAARREAEALRACVEEVLADLQLDRFVPRRTEARLTLAFRRSGLGRPPALDRPQRARPSPSPATGRCSGTPLDVVEAHEPVVIDDEDDAQRAVEAKAHAARRRAVAPRVRSGTIPPQPDTGVIDLALRANLGAVRACWADAVERTGAQPATITLDIDIDQSGLVRSVASDASVDGGLGALTACLRRELGAMRLVPPRTDVRARWALILVRERDGAGPVPARAAAPIEIGRLAAEAMARGDGDAAVRHLTALLAQRPDDDLACGWQIERLHALDALVDPFGDARTEAAIVALGRWLDGHPGAAARCLGAVAAVVLPFATQPHREGANNIDIRGVQLERAVARYRLLLEALPSLPEASTVRSSLASALEVLGNATHDAARLCEAASLYERVVADPTTPEPLRADAAVAAPLLRERVAANSCPPPR